MKIYLMVGIAGSGKTTWARKLVRESAGEICMISQDSIREMLMGRYEYSDESTKLMGEVRDNAIRKLIDIGYDFVLDAVQLTAGRRQRIVNFIRDCNVDGLPLDIYLVWCPEMKRNLEYRLQDPRGMSFQHWKQVIDDMRQRFEPITEAELEDLGASLIMARFGN